MRLPAVVRLSRSFWDDTRNGTAAEKLQIVMRQLAVATARMRRISTLELPRCEMKGQDAESLAEVLTQECWRSAQRWLTSISITITSAMLGQLVFQECWRIAQRWCTSISATMGSARLGQRGLQECCRSAQRWLTSTSTPMTSALSGEGGFELRGVVKPLAFFCRHLALLALCHLFSGPATRKSDILYTTAW
jgi:hypothetical protein